MPRRVSPEVTEKISDILKELSSEGQKPKISELLQILRERFGLIASTDYVGKVAFRDGIELNTGGRPVGAKNKAPSRKGPNTKWSRYRSEVIRLTEEEHLNPTQIARRLSISRTTVYNLLSDDNSPSGNEPFKPSQ